MRRSKPSRLPSDEKLRGSLSLKRQKANVRAKGWRRVDLHGSGLSFVDHLQIEGGQIKTPVKPGSVRFYDLDREILPLETQKPAPGRFYQLGIYSSNELCQVQTNNGRAAVNKSARMFGKISKQKHFRFVLRCMAVSGITLKQFRSLMRIRDIYVRGYYRPYKKHIQMFLFRNFGPEVLELAMRATPRQRRPAGGVRAAREMR